MKTILLVPLVLIAFVLGRFMIDKQVDYDVVTDGIEIPTFTKHSLDFVHQLDDSKSLPFTASAIIDIDNDGVEELFIGGGPNQQDVFYQYTDDSFQQIQPAGYDKQVVTEASFGAVVVDTDRNGYSDLIISRTNGVWLYLNQGGQFTGQKLTLPIPEDTTPLQVAISDLNRDGHFDMYIAGYIKKELVEGQNIFNKEGYGGSSIIVLNNGDNTFRDITDAAGMTYKHNTFMGVFIDIDNDQLEDLVVAHDTGQVRTWKNQGNLKFELMDNPNSNQYSYPMGIAVTDLADDGLADFFFSNVGSTPPGFIVKGDLRDDQEFNPKWILFNNKGNFQFEDSAQQAKLADYEFSWGAIFEDFNLDGLDDLVVSENYIGFPPHKIPFLRLPGRFLMQTPQGEFAATGAESGIYNPYYGITPLTADFNQDGYPDLIHINIAGQSKAFINNGGDANFLKVQLPNTIETIAAKLTVKLSNGKTLYRDVISGEGLSSDQSRVQVFGLENATAKSVKVNYINGQTKLKTGDFSNTTLRFN